jgi:molecular chaperone IbpA
LDNLVHQLESELGRGLIGFDSIFDGFRNSVGTYDSYPPYDVEKIDEHNYCITLALAGFTRDDIEVVQENNWLTIKGKAEEKEEKEGRNFLHRGIARRAFARKVQLAENIEVLGAEMTDGLLHIQLVRNIPEREQPKQIEIK